MYVISFADSVYTKEVGGRLQVLLASVSLGDVIVSSRFTIMRACIVLLMELHAECCPKRVVNRILRLLGFSHCND